MFMQLLLLLLKINKRVQHQLQTSVLLLHHLANQKYHCINRYKWKLQARKRRRRKPQRHRRQGPRNQGNILDINIYERTGIFASMFEDLYDGIKSSIKLPRNYTPELVKRVTPTSLCPRFRLLLVLDYMRNGYKYAPFSARYFNISRSQVAKEVKHIAPKIYAYQSTRQIMRPPATWVLHRFEGVVGMCPFFLQI